jgi:HSP20 family molecular chaperone IbpA
VIGERRSLDERGDPMQPGFAKRVRAGSSRIGVMADGQPDHDRASHDAVVERTADTASTMAPQRVPVNAYETPGAFVIVAALPAVTESDVTVELRDGAVRFWAELRSAGPRTYVLHEWEYGGYERSVELPGAYRRDVEASLGNGQLVVRVLAGDYVTDRAIHPSSG